jgi:nicotinamidase-related amidase
MRPGFDHHIPRTLEDACDPATLAVIVYDMQVGVLLQLPGGGAEAVQRVSQLVDAARAGGYPQFFTRHMSLPVRLMGVSQLRTAMSWQHVADPEKVEPGSFATVPGSRSLRSYLRVVTRRSSTSWPCPRLQVRRWR